MSAAEWSAAAAWLGAALGIVNLVFGLAGRRPVLQLLPDDASLKGSFDPYALRVAATAGATPLLIRHVCFIPRRKGVDSVADNEVSGRAQVAQTFEWVERRRFCRLIHAGGTGYILLRGFKSAPWRLVVIRWSDQRFQPWPWTIFVVTPQKLRDFAQAVDPTSQLA